MLNHSQPDPLPAAPVDPPHDADAVERGRITPPATPTNLANNVMDHNHTPARPGINATQLGPKPPQDKNLRPLYTGVEKMEHNLHEVSLDEMFKTYLDCGGEPTAEDLAAFTYYDEDKLKTVAREPALGPMIVSGSHFHMFTITI
uniref:Non-canonical non-ribosomal peptide synthetase FUB8 ) n=1 Tax=Ganoderma boninense TaxID=34458 RepID=A0A5K1JWY5_9APHY|nr:Non-canonical non-ribosomal peptide synthetase FUB8 (EC (Fusaric acid biosynthesis protein 8) [Ganoderma boninense]